jgi:hypothetical protein
MLVSSVFEMQISGASAPLRRYQNRGERKAQLDDGIGDTFVSVFSLPVTLELELIRTYDRYHRPIARPIVFWLNEWMTNG